MPVDHNRIPVTLSEQACQIALSKDSGVSLVGSVVREIRATPKDISLGDIKTVRHVILSSDEVQALLSFFRGATNVYTHRNDQNGAAICEEGAANARHALWRVGIA